MANEKRNKKEIKYFSMFTGVGGFELGIERAKDSSGNQGNSRSPQCIQSERYCSSGEGDARESNKDNNFQCVGMSEIDKYANQLLAKRFPNIPNFGDCTKIEADKLPDFDMLCGGFPCQSFSIAGKRRGFEDTRGTMFFHIARILEVKRPKIVWLENVKGLLNHNKGETFKVIIQTLSELGYDVQWMVLNSKFFGVPQNRERVFIIGSARGQPRPEILPFRGSYEETGSEIVGTLESDGWEKRHEQIRRVWSTEGNAPTIPTAQGGGVMTKIAINAATKAGYSEAAFGDGVRLEYPESKTARGRVIKGNANTLKKGTEGVVTSNMEIRRLTPTECERLQGFPDGWTEGFSDTQRYKMMGNAVTVNVIESIARRLDERKSIR